MPDTSKMTEDEQMEYLADILIEWYFKKWFFHRTSYK
jgi:hypothetical protein